MFSAKALIVIIQRETEESFMDLFKRYELSSILSFPGEGTASGNILSMLGLDTSEKTIMLALMNHTKATMLMQEMVSLGINLPGRGIAMRLPLSSIGSMRAVKYLIGDIKDEDNEVNTMNEKPNYPYDLILTIAQRGSSDLVMEAARSAGAGGGTIVHSKGTVSMNTAKFFGISLAAEKELILIAARHEKKDNIMHAIMEHAGADTDAHAVVFSLPVEDVVGLRSIMNADIPASQE